MKAAAANPLSNPTALRPIVKAALMMVPRATRRRKPSAPPAKRSPGPVFGGPSGAEAPFLAVSVVDIRTRDRKRQAQHRTQPAGPPDNCGHDGSRATSRRAALAGVLARGSARGG